MCHPAHSDNARVDFISVICIIIIISAIRERNQVFVEVTVRSYSGVGLSDEYNARVILLSR